MRAGVFVLTRAPGTRAEARVAVSGEGAHAQGVGKEESFAESSSGGIPLVRRLASGDLSCEPEVPGLGTSLPALAGTGQGFGYQVPGVSDPAEQEQGERPRRVGATAWKSGHLVE